MALSAPEFIRLVMDRLDADGPTALARRLGWGHHSPAKISRWLSGEHEPDFEATMEMAAAAGLLDAKHPPVLANRDPLELLAETGAEVLQNQRVVLDVLEEIVAALEIRRKAKRAHPKP